MKIVLFTRTGFHHTSFINRLAGGFEIACVVREAYPVQAKTNRAFSSLKRLFGKGGPRRLRDEQFLKRFSEAWSAGFRYHPLMKDYLGAQFDVMTARPETRYLNIGCGEINSPEVCSFIEGLRPDIIAVLGSSVLGPEIIKLPKMAMINIHSGLSPHYRGTWSFGWPIVNREPQYIGVTVHHINPGIDTGDIIYQTRPCLASSDDLNVIFLKVIAEGIELMVKVIEEITVKGSVASYRQPSGVGRLYQMKDFTAEAARTCLRNLEEGIIGEYLKSKEERDAGVRLFGYIAPMLFR